MFRPQTGERGFELERFVDGFVNELFDGRLAPRSQRAIAESAAEALDAGDTDAAHLSRFTVEYRHARIREDVPHFVLVTGLAVVVAEDGNDRDVECGDLARENARLVWQTGVGQIAGEEQHVGRRRYLAEQRLKRTV